MAKRLLLWPWLLLLCWGCQKDECKSAPPTVRLTVRGSVDRLDITLAYDGHRFQRRFDVTEELADGETALSVELRPAPTADFDLDVSIDGLDPHGALIAQSQSQFRATPDGCNAFVVDLETIVPDAGVERDASVDAGVLDDAQVPDVESIDVDSGPTDDGALDAGQPDVAVPDGGDGGFWPDAAAPDATQSVCGDDAIDGSETCDDGNQQDGDGCSSVCSTEDAWSCTGEPSNCTRVYYYAEVSAQHQVSGSTFVDVPGAEIVITPDVSQTWMIFASGLMWSADHDQAAEVRLMINNSMRDLMGHRTTDTTNNAAGFLTFNHLYRESTQQTVKLQMRSEQGRSYVSDVRLIVALVPPNAHFQYIGQSHTSQLQGYNREILALDFTPSAPGDYYIFGKATQDLDPATGAMHTWLEHDGIRYPETNFATFTNSTQINQPMFAAFSTTLPATPQTIALRGNSGGDAPIWLWWDSDYIGRAVVTINTGAAGILAGHPVALTFDHANSVNNGVSLANGDDIRIVSNQKVEYPRVLDDESAWNDAATTIWFPAPADVAANSSLDLYLYFGNSAAASPPDDPTTIFDFYDTFSGSSVDLTKWTIAGSPTIALGMIRLTGGAEMTATVAAVDDDAIYELSANVPQTGTLRLAALCEPATCGQYAWLHNNGNWRCATFNGADLDDNGCSITTPTSQHLYKIHRDGSSLTHYYQDGTLLQDHSSKGGSIAALAPHFYFNGTAEGSIDWVRVRRYVTPEPSVTLGTPQYPSVVGASTWSYLRIMAFRADAWGAAYHDESMGLSTTMSTAFTQKNALSVPTPKRRSNFLAIQAQRISGDSFDSTERRVGVLRQDGTAVLSTSHKVNRDGSTHGYHHTAGLVNAFTTASALTFSNGFLSPDGISVESAASVIIVLQYP